MSKNLICKKLKQKQQTLSAAALVLLLAFSAFIAILPTVSSHTPAWNIPTYAYVSTVPKTVGVGQYTTIVFWLDKFPPTAAGSAGDRWRGHMIYITAPDGSKTQLGPYESGSVGSGGVNFIPNQVGKYIIVHSWPGQVLARGVEPPNTAGLANVGDYYANSTSEPFTLTVTQDPLEPWVEAPMPDYWERPIPTTNRDWAKLASDWIIGSWLRYPKFQEKGQAPNSAHVLYALPVIQGGIGDAYYGAEKLDTTDYETPFTDPIVMAGKIYYGAGTHPNYGYYCVDLKTGKVDWFKNGTDNGLNNPVSMSSGAGGGGAGPSLAQFFLQPSFGYLLHYKSPNGEGVKPYLFMTQGSTWYMFDGNTGNWVLTLTNVPGGTAATDENGNILRYSYNAATGRFLGWNLTQAIGPAGPTGSAQLQWEPRVGATINAVNDTGWYNWGPDPSGRWAADDILPRTGHTMNVTGPTGIPGSLTRVIQDENRKPQLFFFRDMQGGIGATSQTITVVRIDENAAPYSPFPQKTDTQNWNLGYGVTKLWSKEIPLPAGGNLTWSLGPISYEEKVFTIWAKETRQWYGYSLDNGAFLWGPTAATPGWDMYGVGGYYAYGNLYAGGYSGLLVCYDIKTGVMKWNYTLTGIGWESVVGDYPIQWGGIADGKIFIFSSEHAPTSPMWRGAYLRAINATTGKEIWKTLTYISEENSLQTAIADGCIIAGNGYDNRLYVYGKGPSATTVTAPDTSVPLGSSVLIRGTVTDQSPGAKGTPAIADAYMDEWMDYLYMKQGFPATAQGVTVKLSAYDSNGNYQDIGTTTVDNHGNFGKSWKPPITGDYHVMAEFEGSESYGSSSATTYFCVGTAITSAPASPYVSSTPTQTMAPIVTPTSTLSPSPSQAVQPPTSAAPTTTYIAIGTAVIIIVAAAAALILRKRRK